MGIKVWVITMNNNVNINATAADYVIEAFACNNRTKATELCHYGLTENYNRETVETVLKSLKDQHVESTEMVYRADGTIEVSFRSGNRFIHLSAFPKGTDRVNKKEFFEAKLVIRDLEERYRYDEEELRKAVRCALPSWKLTKESEYGLHQGNGYQECRFQIYKKDARIDVHFYDYVD